MTELTVLLAVLAFGCFILVASMGYLGYLMSTNTHIARQPIITDSYPTTTTTHWPPTTTPVTPSNRASRQHSACY
jgi:hypothetical protein